MKKSFSRTQGGTTGHAGHSKGMQAEFTEKYDGVLVSSDGVLVQPASLSMSINKKINKMLADKWQEMNEHLLAKA
ncbi:hypothetical protein MHYP_G00215290 [Metynnis hypsauchen]